MFILGKVAIHLMHIIAQSIEERMNRERERGNEKKSEREREVYGKECQKNKLFP